MTEFTTRILVGCVLCVVGGSIIGSWMARRQSAWEPIELAPGLSLLGVDGPHEIPSNRDRSVCGSMLDIYDWNESGRAAREAEGWIEQSELSMRQEVLRTCGPDPQLNAVARAQLQRLRRLSE